MNNQYNFSITIRSALKNDLPNIIAADQDLFGYGTSEDPKIFQARLEVFPQGCIVVEGLAPAMNTSLFIGYATSEKWNDYHKPALDEDPYLTHKPDGRIFNITALAITRPYQNRGWGKQLLAYLMNVARNERCYEVVLETARAQNFYLKHAFETVGIRKERDVTLYIMRKQLIV